VTRSVLAGAVWRWMGSFLGISVGCLMGMLPLLFMTSEGAKKAAAVKNAHQQHIAALEQRLAGMAVRLRQEGVSAHELEALLGSQ
jgi:hypothetical protein